MRPRVVFGYAGHGDVSHTLRQLAEVHDALVVTLTLDLGQGRDLEEVRDRALAAGAARAHVLDVREAFARAAAGTATAGASSRTRGSR